MHAISHSLTHRGSSASRTRSRWQPYSSVPSSRSPSSACLNTPATTVSTPPSTQPSSSCESDLLKSSSALPLSQKDGTPRDVQKSRCVNGLVDLAVKSLCEIWHPHDIPAVFSAPTRTIVPAPIASSSVSLPSTHQTNIHVFHPRYSQLPSPVSPGYPLPSPSTPFSTTSQYSDNATDNSSTSSSISSSSTSSKPTRSNVVPLKGFVHEVLRRSRTSCSVLQTALCYLEAIRCKVPNIIQQEKLGNGVRGEPDQSFRIIQADESEASFVDEAMTDDLIGTSYSADSDSSCGSVEPTVRIMDTSLPPTPSFCSTSQPEVVTSLRRPGPSVELPPLPPLPSPLLCPRRSFLAALILASKFTQDKCYSNRAWAKLAGLPAREIGRCERALGEALEWRLWVGKLPCPRGPVSRSRSDGALLMSGSSSFAEALNLGSTPGYSMLPPSTLRRSSTLPASAFASTLSRGASALSLRFPQPSLEMAMVPQTLSLDSHLATQFTPMPAPPMTTWSHGEAGTDISYSAPYPAPLSDASSTPMLSVSPTSTVSSQDSLYEERTINMASFVDVASPLAMKVDPSIPARPSGYAFAYPGEWPSTAGEYMSEGGISGSWDGVGYSLREDLRC